MPQAVNSRPLTSVTGIRPQASPCGIYGEQSGTRTYFYPSSSVSVCQAHSTDCVSVSSSTVEAVCTAPVCLSVCMSARLPASLSVCLPGRLSACLSICLPAYLSACLSVCLPIYLPACPSFCLSVLLNALGGL